MAMFKHRLTRQQIEQDYTHYALIFGIVPIYFNDSNNGVCIRNGWPEWLLDFFQAMFDVYCVIATSLNPELDPMYPIKLTKEIKGGANEVN